MQRYQADRAVHKRAEDLLGRYPFAQQLADAFIGWREDESLVVSLTGAWGSGKTSIKNFVVDVLRPEEGPQRADVLEFSPWELSGTGNVEEHFFDRIGAFLGRKDAAKQDLAIAETWSRWTTALNVPQAMLEPLAKELSMPLVALGLLTMGVSAATVAKLPFIIVGAVVVLLGNLLSISTKITESVAGWFASKAKVATSPAALKIELAELLRKRERPLIIVIDDLDRLMSGEIRLIFRLIKANADLPRLLYFVLFEHDSVTHALEREGYASGEKYLEKIIQAPFTVPIVQDERMSEVIVARLNEVLRPLPDFSPDDEARWTDLFYQHLHAYFTNLRDVYRFLAAFEFHAGVFLQNGCYEVNVVDLFALEILRMFEHPIYERLSSNKRLLVHPPRHSMTSNTDAPKQALQSILEGAKRPDTLRATLSALFPFASWAWGGHIYGDAFDAKWAITKRVATETHFDKYFHFAIPKGDIAQHEIDHLIKNSGSRDAVRSQLQQYKADGRIERFLIRVDYEKDRIPIENIVPFISALFDEGEDLVAPAAMFGSDPNLQMFRMIYWCLRRFNTLPEREAALEQAINATDALYGPTHTVSFEEPREDRRSDLEPIIAAASYPRFQRLCTDKIAAAAAAGRLLHHAHALNLFYYWLEWTDGAATREWASKVIQQPADAAAFVRCFVQIVKSQGFGSLVTRQKPYIQLKSIEKFVSLDALDHALPDSTASSDDQTAINLFRKALERRRKGLPDREPGSLDKDE